MNIRALICILLLIVVEYILVFIRMYKIRKNNIELCEKRKDTCKLKVTGEVVDKIEESSLIEYIIKYTVNGKEFNSIWSEMLELHNYKIGDKVELLVNKDNNDEIYIDDKMLETSIKELGYYKVGIEVTAVLFVVGLLCIVRF